MANKVQITTSQLEFNKKLSKHDDVQDALKGVARKAYASASGRLAAHRKTGSHSIEIERIKNVKYGHIDWYVSMVGPAAVSVEYGHWSPNHNRYVQGLYIMTNALLGARL